MVVVDWKSERGGNSLEERLFWKALRPCALTDCKACCGSSLDFFFYLCLLEIVVHHIGNRLHNCHGRTYKSSFIILQIEYGISLFNQTFFFCRKGNSLPIASTRCVLYLQYLLYFCIQHSYYTFYLFSIHRIPHVCCLWRPFMAALTNSSLTF